MHFLRSLVGFLGRALLSLIFISSAVNKFFGWQMTMQYFTQALNDSLALSVGMPGVQALLEWGLDNATLLLVIAALFEFVGGLMVFLGIWVRLGAFLLILFLIPATLLFHHFWLLQEPERMMQMIMCMKNVAIMGGLLALIAYYGRGCSSSAKEVKGE